MTRPICLLFLALSSLGMLRAADGDKDVVFRTDVSLARVDAQVVDRDNRAITGLRVEDFVLKEEGRPQPIHNFASEDMPVDVLLLLDVSASMRPNVERVASASHQALHVLRDEDRMAIMVFDRSTRLRLPFRSSRDAVERELQALLREETFRGGTDITLGLLDAADYVARNARRDARRAIVIVTDDQTERDRNEAAVSRALTRADAVLCALIAPDMMQHRAGYPGGGGGGGGNGSTWPGGSAGGPLGGIIFGRRGPNGGGRRGQGGGMPRTQSAGTAEIARQSGGDSMPLSDASDLETTLARLRQRYALHFHLPEGVQPGQERNIQVDLTAATRRRYPDAEVRYRRVYITPDAHGSATGPTVVTRAPAGGAGGSSDPYGSAPVPVSGRRPAVSEPSGPSMGGPSAGEAPGPAAQPQTQTAPAPSGGWPAAETQPQQQPAPSDSSAKDPPPSEHRGWRELKPGEQP